MSMVFTLSCVLYIFCGCFVFNFNDVVRYSHKLTEATVRDEIEKYVPQIVSFVEKYVSLRHQQLGTVQ